VVGRGTPKNTVEVAAEARVAMVTDLVNDARAGQAVYGEVGLPLPCTSALGVPLADASPLKLKRGREVKPGQKAVPSQGVQAGTVPTVPLVQPRQERLWARATASEPYPANAEGRRGSGQVRGAQSAREAADAELDCFPAGQAKGRARHCVFCIAPGEAVVFPSGQAVHWVAELAPKMLL
jgi:hypothetical protein